MLNSNKKWKLFFISLPAWKEKLIFYENWIPDIIDFYKAEFDALQKFIENFWKFYIIHSVTFENIQFKKLWCVGNVYVKFGRSFEHISLLENCCMYAKRFINFINFDVNDFSSLIIFASLIVLVFFLYRFFVSYRKVLFFAVVLFIIQIPILT